MSQTIALKSERARLALDADYGLGNVNDDATGASIIADA